MFTGTQNNRGFCSAALSVKKALEYNDSRARVKTAAVL
ncbi:hypothetical protein ADIAL_1357 [Alkalibacterium sp. AK22]|nr:hypothetical protein ADIAL_1357 [Alkalibacterium sp. AK22]